MKRYHRYLWLLLLGVILGALVYAVWPKTTLGSVVPTNAKGTDSDISRSATTSKISPFGQGPLYASHNPTPSTQSLIWSPAQARAWAHLFDGRPLDPESQAAVPAMRLYLATIHPTSGLGYATVTPQGVMSLGALLTDDYNSLLKGLSEPRLDTERRCHLIPTTGTIHSAGPGLQTVTGPGVWAAMEHPGGTLQFTVSEGEEYALAFFCDDPGTLRLNGGLIIPGRFYSITQSATITGGPTKIHLRPRSALKEWLEGPLVIPRGDG